MNNNINIADILRDCPTGTKLYSPICGESMLKLISQNIDGENIVVWSLSTGNSYAFNEDGSFTSASDAECLLFPSREMRDWTMFKQQPGCPLKPFDLVLARDSERSPWFAEIFSHYSRETSEYVCIGGAYDVCIPYEGNEHLLGTKEPYTEEGGTE